MITKPMAFVLGAGASSCYEFPLGQRLCSMVIEEVQERRNTYDVLLANTDFAADHVKKFQEQLAFSGQNSIDAFLELRQEFLAVGKAAMSTILMRYEEAATLWRFQSNNWMRYLFDRMRARTLEEFAKNQVAFITFNFDRSLEYFLFTSLQRTFGADDKACAHVLSHIPIIHLHGRLGYLPWQGGVHRDYNGVITREAIRLCVNDIKLVHEELKDGRDKDFTEAKRLLHVADRIYVLGFGFAAVNVSRLELNKLEQNKAIATANGFTGHEVATLNQRCGGRISIYPNYDIDSLFRNMVAWD